MSGDVLADQAYAVALAELPGMGPARLRAVLDRWPPAEAWSVVCSGRAMAAGAVADACRPDSASLAVTWRTAAARVDVAGVWQRYRDAGVGVAVLGGDAYPDALASDAEAPAVVCWLGDPAVVEGPRVGIVGSRRCTRYGRDVGFELGHDLAAAGVRVVSGLALGIDGAAHSGALAAPGGAPPIAVVGSGLDVVYPRRHVDLWRRVAGAGVIFSESPMGAAPEGWRFPLRNRLIAALADVLVVVESRHQGGSRHTVDAAIERDRVVLAVPGPVRSPLSTYPNELLHQGVGPARDVVDVLVALGLAGRLPMPAPVDAGEPEPDVDGPADPVEAAVLDAVGWEPVTLDEVTERAGRSLGAVAAALARLEAAGRVAERDGRWERVAGRSGAIRRRTAPA
jgi:DNA processing protein